MNSPQTSGRLQGSHAELVEVALRDGEDARRYSRDESYTAGELVRHAHYGLGVVVQRAPGRIDVRFGDRDRMLACIADLMPSVGHPEG